TSCGRSRPTVARRPVHPVGAALELDNVGALTFLEVALPLVLVVGAELAGQVAPDFLGAVIDEGEDRHIDDDAQQDRGHRPRVPAGTRVPALRWRPVHPRPGPRPRMPRSPGAATRRAASSARSSASAPSCRTAPAAPGADRRGSR